MHDKVKALYKNYREYALMVRKMEGTVLEVCRHPEATASDLLNASQAYRRVYTSFRELQLKTADALRKKGYSMLSDCVLTGSK